MQQHGEKIMADAVSFWLDNKMSSGIRIAEIGNQVLVFYRERYYVIADGAALVKGGKTIRYAKSTLPALWKRALRGPVAAPVHEHQETVADEASMPLPTRTKKERLTMNRPSASQPPAATTAAVPAPQAPVRISPPRKKPEAKPAAQASVTAVCPYCNHKHDLPVEKGKNGKAFILVCGRCSTEFAVRFVQVVQYQAQTAGFR